MCPCKDCLILPICKRKMFLLAMECRLISDYIYIRDNKDMNREMSQRLYVVRLKEMADIQERCWDVFDLITGSNYVERIFLNRKRGEDA